MVETFHKSSGNVFEDTGFTPAEAAVLTPKSMLITAIVETIDKRKLTQKEAAQRCRTDQPALSKVLRGRMESVTIDGSPPGLPRLVEQSKSMCALTTPKQQLDTLWPRPRGNSAELRASGVRIPSNKYKIGTT
jgi:predicted XRE-type DNA-binding protein